MAWFFHTTASMALAATSQTPVTTEPFTVSCFWRTNDTVAGKDMIQFVSTASNVRRFFSIGAAEQGVAGTQTATNTRTVATANSGVLGNWNHQIAWYLANNDRRVMLNGGNVATSSVNAPAGTAGQFVIGGILNTDGAPMLGDMEDVAVWDIQLSESEGRWLAEGHSALELKHRYRNLKFYRSLKHEYHDVEFGEFDRIKLTNQNSARPSGDSPFVKEKTDRRRLWWNSFVTGGTTTLVSLTAAASAIVEFIRQIGLNNTTTAVGIAGTTMQAGKGLSASVSGAANRILEIGKTLAAEATGSAFLEALRVFLVALNAATTAAATISLQIGKIVSTAVSGVVSSAIQVGKGLSAAASGSSAFVRQIGSNLTATTIGVAGTTMQVGKSLIVDATGSAARIISVGKTLIADAVATAAISVSQAFLITLATDAIAVATIAVSNVFSVALAATASVAASLTSLFTAAVAAVARAVGHAGGLGIGNVGRWKFRRSHWRKRL